MDSVKSLVQERLDTMEKSVTSIRAIKDELGERQKILKARLTASYYVTYRLALLPFDLLLNTSFL